MGGRPLVQPAAEYLIHRACRRLTAGVREERRREWMAELPAILADPDVRPVLRQARALRFAAGTIRTARRAHGVFRGRLSAADARSAGIRLFISVTCWLAVVCAVRIGAAAHLRAPHGSFWIALFLLASVANELFGAAQVIKLIRWLCQHD